MSVRCPFATQTQKIAGFKIDLQGFHYNSFAGLKVKVARLIYPCLCVYVVSAFNLKRRRRSQKVKVSFKCKCSSCRCVTRDAILAQRSKGYVKLKYEVAFN